MGEDTRPAGPSVPVVKDTQGLNDAGLSTASTPRPPANNDVDRNSALGGLTRSPSRTGQSASQSKNFEFVLVTDTESRRQVRRHAMRQYMRQRRLDSIARLESSRVSVGGWTTRQPSNSPSSGPSSRVEEVQGEHDPAEFDTTPEGSKHGTPEEDGSLLLVPNGGTMRRAEGSPLVAGAGPPDPRASPGSGDMRDPFNSYPIAISHADHELIQHFVVTYPSMMYKFLDPMPNNPMMEIFRQFALQDRVPFQAMLAIASKHRAGVGGKTESVQSLTHKMRALRLMNERIQMDSGGQHDGTIYAVATMAVIEKWSKDASVEQMHFRGLASMIRSRGGMRGMRATCPFLESVLYWVDLSCAPNAIASTSLPWTGAVPDSLPEKLDFLVSDLHLAIPHSSTMAEGTEDLCDRVRACEDFLRFFRRLHELEHIALNSPGNISSGTATGRLNRFGPSTQLYTMLTTLPDYDHGIRDVRFIDEYTCMACLLYLNVALYDCYSNSTSFDRYLDWMASEIKKSNPYENPSITSVLWLFLRNGGYPSGETGDAGERSWVVSRMLRVVKRLEWKHRGTLWDRLRQILIGFVTAQQECALGSDQVTEEALMARQRKRRQSREYFWDENEMRKDILDVDRPILTTCPSRDAPTLV